LDATITDSTKPSTIAHLPPIESGTIEAPVKARPPCVPSRAAKSSKSPESSHGKMPARDAEFMRRLRQSALDGTLAGPLASLVQEDCARSIKRLRLILDSTDGRIKPAMKGIPRRWYDKHSRPAAKRHRVAAECRDATLRLRGEMAHYALYRLGEVYDMSVNLGADIEADALKKGRTPRAILLSESRAT
jgi:hypothetical protein